MPIRAIDGGGICYKRFVSTDKWCVGGEQLGAGVLADVVGLTRAVGVASDPMRHLPVQWRGSAEQAVRPDSWRGQCQGLGALR